ncbi:hypothetical protein [Microcoleus sp. CAWBG58]|uniref:hypothetical protein n=1 Tax=Microcoleus sp. CAWBG58 TaxID=2841651 RepID=UPI0025CC4D56|nr:hypothetical protein [Microcoleus sp. CAWBG58]
MFGVEIKIRGFITPIFRLSGRGCPLAVNCQLSTVNCQLNEVVGCVSHFWFPT